MCKSKAILFLFLVFLPGAIAVDANKTFLKSMPLDLRSGNEAVIHFLSRHLNASYLKLKPSDLLLIQDAVVPASNDLTGPELLETRYVIYQQTHLGIPLRDHQVKLVLRNNRVISAHATLEPELKLEPLARTSSELETAARSKFRKSLGRIIYRSREIHKSGLDFNVVTRISFEGDDRVAWISERDLVVTLKDEHFDAVDFQGHASGQGVFFDPVTTGSNYDTLDLSHLACTVNSPPGSGLGSIPVQTTEAGDFIFSIPDSWFASGTPTLDLQSLSGPYVQIIDGQNQPISLSIPLSPNSTQVSLSVNNPAQPLQTAQVNAYFHANRQRDWLLRLGVNPFGLQNQLPISVNVTGSCNGLFIPSPPSIRLYTGNGTCINASFDTFIYHEYGHYIDHLSGGISNIPLSEGWGDTLAALLSRQPLFAENFYFSGYLRTADNNYQYPPGDLDGVHAVGTAWSGFNWHLREYLIQQYGNAGGHRRSLKLTVPSILANSGDIPSAVEQVLIRDDDDNDLTNGTPHFESIARSASRHQLAWAIPGTPRVNRMNSIALRSGDTLTLEGQNLIMPFAGSNHFSFQNTTGDIITPDTQRSASQASTIVPPGIQSTYVETIASDIRAQATFLNILQTEVTPLVRVINSKDKFGTPYGDGNHSLSLFVGMQGARGLAKDPSEKLYALDSNSSIRRAEVAGAIDSLSGPTALYNYGPSLVTSPVGATFGVFRNYFNHKFYVIEGPYSRVKTLDAHTGLFQNILAGTGTAGYTGDGIPADQAKLNFPSGITSGIWQNAPAIFIADTLNHRVRVVHLPSGIIHTVAGDGTASNCTSGSPAIGPCLNQPKAVLFHRGILYIADSGNHQIKSLDLQPTSPQYGLLNSIAGNGLQGLTGDFGPATSAKLRNPTNIAIGIGGEIFFLDQGNNRVRRVNSSGIITTVAGNGGVGQAQNGGPAISSFVAAPSGLVYLESKNLLAFGVNESIFSYTVPKVHAIIPTRPTLQSVNVVTLSPGNYEIIVSGTRFGVTSFEGNGRIFFNGILVPHSAWASQEVRFLVSSSSLPTGSIEVFVGGFESNTLNF